MIETAIAVVIMLLGDGGYQALASVDFKPIRINIDRRPKVIDNTVERAGFWFEMYENELKSHQKTRDNWQKTRVELKAIESRKPKPIECVFCRGNHGTSSCPKMWDRIVSYTNTKSQPGCIWCTSDYLCTNCKYMNYGHH